MRETRTLAEVCGLYLCLIWSSFSGSLMMTWTPIFILVFCRLKSRQAILAFATRLTIPFNGHHSKSVNPQSSSVHQSRAFTHGSYLVVWRQKKWHSPAATHLDSFKAILLSPTRITANVMSWDIAANLNGKSNGRLRFTQTHLVSQQCSSVHIRWPGSSPSDCGRGLSAHWQSWSGIWQHPWCP